MSTPQRDRRSVRDLVFVFPILSLVIVALVLACSANKARDAADDAQPAAESAVAKSRGPVAQRDAPRGAAGIAGRVAHPVSPPAASPARLSALGYGVLEESYFDTERYDAVDEPGFKDAGAHPLSTFSADVDTASYSNVRRFLRDGELPPAGAVRIEELLNYFDYRDPAPRGEHPFAVHMELFEAPWSPAHRLVRIGLQSTPLPEDEAPPRNLVFLLDVSGSMQPLDKLPLIQRSMLMLVDRLRPEDHVAIVVYAGASGLVLPPTSGADRATIREAIQRVRAGGSTNGGQGIRLAYRVARQNFEEGAINRVILATDGDFNVGTTSRSDLVELIERQRESGVFLTVLGVGRGNLNDAMIEQLANRGNGNYAYLDDFAEAKKVLVEEVSATLIPVAKDVKLQVEFNPARVAAWRLVGYENRHLENRDFNDDKKDAGEIGAGHHVTALYELVPVGKEADVGDVDPLKYQQPRQPATAASDEWLTLKVRYKQPDADESQLLTHVLQGEPARWQTTSDDARFAASVALFGMLLRDSEHTGDGSWTLVEALARGAYGADPRGERAEFRQLAAIAKELDGGDAAQLAQGVRSRDALEK